MKEALPEGFWTYPPVALLSLTVSALAMLATATNVKNEVSRAISDFVVFLGEGRYSIPHLPSHFILMQRLNFTAHHPDL